MAVYFIAENESTDYSTLRVKIGYSAQVQVRLRTLQTGSPYELKLMGWIESQDDRQLERTLHEKYANQHAHHEWFNLPAGNVLTELKLHGVCAYLATEGNTFEIKAFDRNGIPEFYGPWKWAEVDDSEFCPKCGCSCGLQYNENYGAERCLNCGIIYEYEEELRRSHRHQEEA